MQGNHSFPINRFPREVLNHESPALVVRSPVVPLLSVVEHTILVEWRSRELDADEVCKLHLPHLWLASPQQEGQERIGARSLATVVCSLEGPIEAFPFFLRRNLHMRSERNRDR